MRTTKPLRGLESNAVDA